MNEPVRVPASGPTSAKLVIVGEAPADHEVRQGQPFCIEATQRVLTADLRWVPIYKVSVGDELLTVSEFPEHTNRGISQFGYRSLQIATVTRKVESVQECRRLITSNGELLATKDHRMLTEWRAGLHGGWREIQDLQRKIDSSKRGTRLFKLLDCIEPDTSYEAGWLAGFFDGEGHVLGSKLTRRSKRVGNIGFSQNKGETLDYACHLLDLLKIKTRRHDEQQQYTGSTICRVYIAGRVCEQLYFLMRIRPRRLLKHFQNIVRKFSPRWIKPQRVETLAHFNIGERSVVDITTTAGTFVCEGFIVHNCGPAGFRLREWLRTVGINPLHVYICNLLEYQAPSNKIHLVKRDNLEAWMVYLHERITALTDPWVIVACGNYPLYALTGKGKVHWHMREGKDTRPGILEWRGSILEYLDLNGRRIKLIPTIHPSATLHQPSLERDCLIDWKRIKAELEFREVRWPSRTHEISPSLSMIEQFYNEVLTTPDCVLAIDIENPAKETKAPIVGEEGTPIRYKTGPKKGRVRTKVQRGYPEIVCISFSTHPSHSLTVPLTLSHWDGDDRLKQAWHWMKCLCECSVEKVLHNGLYDSFHLADRDIYLVNWKWDTLHMHHVLDASAKHALHACASVDTREPFWKHEAKEFSTYGSNWSQYLTYAGKDAAVTRELYDVYHEKLTSRVLISGETALQFYLRHYTDLFPAFHDLQRHGIQIDGPLRHQRYTELQRNCAELRDKLTALTGVVLYATKGLSTKKIQTYLYDTLGLPHQVRKREGGIKTTTADEVAVRRLAIRYPEQVGETATLILQHRRLQQLSTFYKGERLDPDGRFRSSYSFNTEAGRSSSSKNPRGTGADAQNIDREARDIFIADEGCLFVDVDLSAVEARIDYLLIARLTGNSELLDRARARPDEYDQHLENASHIFNVPMNQITKEQRYFGKKAVHAAFRDAQGKRLAEECLKDGYVVTDEEAQGWIDAFKRRVPGVEDLFRWVRRRMLTDGFLENTWGRRLYFPELTLQKTVNYHIPAGLLSELYRQGFSFDPQSEAADLMNQHGLKPLHGWLQSHSVAHINVHNHDSLLVSVQPRYAYELTKFLVDSLEKPHIYYGIELSVPCEVTIGTTWKGQTKFKRMPTETVFMDAVHQVMGGTA